MRKARPFRLAGPPLALQIMALLVGGLIVAQLVTLALTLVLPPAPKAQYGLDDIASTLAGASDGGRGRGLQRIVQSGPPDVSGPGWLVSEASRRDLAQRMGVDERRVSLAFYTPLPFAGAAGPRAAAMANDGPPAPLRISWTARADAPLLMLAQYEARPGTGPIAPGGPFRGMPDMNPAVGALPPLPFRHGNAGEMSRRSSLLAGAPRFERSRPLVGVDPRAGGGAVRLPDYGNAPSSALLRGGEIGVRSGQEPAVAVAGAPMLAGRSPGAEAATIPPPLLLPPETRLRTAPPPLRDQPTISAPATQRIPAPPIPDIPQPPAPRAAAPPAPATADREAHAAGQPATGASRPVASPATVASAPAGLPIRIAPRRRALFGLAPAPFVEGDFVAALRLEDRRWAVVQPAPEPFPNVWQRRVLLWFAIALALVAPVGWLFARRLVKPLDRFAGAAEQLGRDPATAIGVLDGPAEIGRAAHAFNLMQNRLRSFVDDRTAMVGAISHDLRTPLTRMRFRIEDIGEDEVRDGLLEEVDEMEAMIAQVIAFLRDASAPAPRERLDLATLVDDVAQDARLVGGDVVVERVEPAQVEVDVLGMKRLLDNLLENAMKYGVRARVRLRTDLDEAIAEIIDDGPGLPDEEIERVFEPFYRSEAARASEKAGSGLGLAVCRSIARAHGGDIRLRRLPDGFAAELRVPLVYGAEKPMPA